MTAASPATAPAIEVAGLRKSFGDTLVLDGIDLRVLPGQVFALLGPNGAGKTTTVQVLCTLLRPDAGAVGVAGHDLATDPDRIREAIGVTGQFSAVDKLLTGRENLLLMADLHHLDRSAGEARADELLDWFELADAASQPPATYSGGMVRRLDLAMTLVRRPSVLFLDEPTAGLDPRSRHTMWRIVRELVADGVTVFLTTQYLEEADELADEVAVLDRGRIVASGPPDQLKRQVGGGHVTLRFADPDGLTAAATRLGEATVDEGALSLHVPSGGSVRELRELLARLDQHEVEELSMHQPDLDDVFLALTGSEVPRVTGDHDDAFAEEVAR